jgi:hypothetical protein
MIVREGAVMAIIIETPHHEAGYWFFELGPDKWEVCYLEPIRFGSDLSYKPVYLKRMGVARRRAVGDE